MKNRIGLSFFIIMLMMLAACGNNNADNNKDMNMDDLDILEATLDVTEEVDVDETVDMHAKVTYGEEDVDDADEVVFEVWEEGDKDNSEMIDAENNEDGSYTAETSFDHDGLFHIQVHVTAREMHTMPKKEVTVGDGGDYEDADEENDETAFHTEGFDMMLMEPEDVEVDDEVDLMTHITMEEDPLKDADVRYEIWKNEEESDQHIWVDAEEDDDGEYEAHYTFENEGNYTIQVHVENDDGLHEHKEYQVDVN